MGGTCDRPAIDSRHYAEGAGGADFLCGYGDETKPPHSVEFVQLAAARLQGELTYTHALLERISTGAYAFVDEAPAR